MTARRENKLRGDFRGGGEIIQLLVNLKAQCCLATVHLPGLHYTDSDHLVNASRSNDRGYRRVLGFLKILF